MHGYKRNQALEAISVTLGQGRAPSLALHTDIRRLLEADRDRAPTKRSKQSVRANYAFFSGEAPGKGTEVLFSTYEVFALCIAVSLMQGGRPQATTVSILRRVRPLLEPKHAEILRWDPVELFDEEKIRETAQPGDFADPTTRKVYIRIMSPLGERNTDKTPEIDIVEPPTPLFPPEPGRSMTFVELTALAHKLRNALEETKPSKRGRGSE